jgi:seryl-tRNA synthetase
MRGRRPSGPEAVERLPGSEQAKQRARTLLETITGSCRVLEACQRLEISEQRFDQLRAQGLEALVGSMESGRAGRPPRKPSPEQQEIAALKQQVADLEVRLQAEKARTEIALVLPNVVQDEVPSDNLVKDNEPDQPPEKKTRQSTRSPRSARRHRPGRKKNTCNASSNSVSRNRPTGNATNTGNSRTGDGRV